MKRILSLLLVLMIVMSLSACRKKVVDQDDTSGSQLGHYISIFIDGKEYVVHSPGAISLQDWYNEYGQPDGWILEDGEIYTSDQKNKIDMAGMTVSQEGLWSGQCFAVVAADSQKNKEDASSIEDKMASGELYKIPEMNSADGIPEFAKTTVGVKEYCYKIDNPNYETAFSAEFNNVDQERFDKYYAFLKSNNPAVMDDKGNGEYFVSWDWGSITIYYHKIDGSMNLAIAQNR